MLSYSDNKKLQQKVNDYEDIDVENLFNPARIMEK